ncbi:MAG: hypothetical protein CL583_08740 [Alteromonadaceae bacterium]|nr:hypothetical protein [Alteromonadaceae bacterium]
MTSTSATSTLVIQFCKWPAAGNVKTRLIPALGEQGAVDAHLALSTAVLENLLVAGFPVELWWDRAPDDLQYAESSRLFDLLKQNGVKEQVQCEGNLGQRMSGALRDGLERAERVIIVGSDCPAVQGEYVRKAAAALEKTDVVLGPAEDGGYVLIGVRNLESRMFDGVEWGTDKVLLQTAQRAEEVGLTVGRLNTLWDVDEVEDWYRYLDSTGVADSSR